MSNNLEDRRKKLEGDIKELEMELMYAQLDETDEGIIDLVQDRLDAKRHELNTLYGRKVDDIVEED